jgi:hypothetical protein
MVGILKGEAMKYIIAFVMSLGVWSAGMAQDNPYDTTASMPMGDSITIDQPVVIDVFVVGDEQEASQTEFGKACTMKRQETSDQTDLSSAQAFKMKGKDMRVEKDKNGQERVKFHNDMEALDYHKTKKGKVHYKYNYFKDKNNQVSFKKKKNGKGQGKFQTQSMDEETAALIKQGSIGVERDVSSCMR